jgi:hypothetical protein
LDAGAELEGWRPIAFGAAGTLRVVETRIVDDEPVLVVWPALGAISDRG